MRYIKFFTAIATSVVIVSCGSSDKETQATPTTTIEGNTAPATSTTSTPTTTTPGNIPAPTVATTPGTVSSPSASTTNTGINPPHGQPGHRCDIAEGASLNSKPSTPSVSTPSISSSTPVNISQPVVTPTSPSINSSKPAKTGAGINPAHGQPGHRCDIAVGAPLDSKPIQASIQQPTTTANPTPAPAVLPYTPVSTQSAAATPVAKGMNPAHGQPGHRCDISVGAPLDSKPTTPAVTTEANKPKQ